MKNTMRNVNWFSIKKNNKTIDKVMQLAGISNITCLLARKTASVNTRATDTHTTNKNYELSWNGWTIVIEMETTLVIGGELYWYIETQYSQKLPRLLKTPCELQRVSMLVINTKRQRRYHLPAASVSNSHTGHNALKCNPTKWVEYQPYTMRSSASLHHKYYIFWSENDPSGSVITWL